ncbi:MAG: hypothetical protein LBR00_04195 [Clostridiales Family XIII bacterium]|jgi:ribosomal protein S27AE|nr:hypothetical protein [Clostridiales Family XIII bacterium]
MAEHADKTAAAQAAGAEGERWSCAKCGVPLARSSTVFAYMGMTFAHEVMRCPKCGMVFIPRELADGKMAEVEMLMEDK